MPAINFDVDVDALYAGLLSSPARTDVVPILVARVQDLLTVADRTRLDNVDSTWADKVAQIYGGLLSLCAVDQILSQLAAASADDEGTTARRIRFQFARALPEIYGSLAFSLAKVMLRAAADNSQDPAMVAAITPAQVTAVSPLNGAINVPVNTTVTATFDEDMDGTSLTPATFILANPAGAQVPATVTYNSAQKQAVLTPSNPLTAGVTYTARLKGGIVDPRVKDSQGVPLSSDLTWPFTTA
jgi:hypothetical protein